MPRGDKTAYTGKQKRQAERIEEGYKKRGVSGGEAERRAWATVNKQSGGGMKKKAKGSQKGERGTARGKRSSSASGRGRSRASSKR